MLKTLIIASLSASRPKYHASFARTFSPGILLPQLYRIRRICAI